VLHYEPSLPSPHKTPRNRNKGLMMYDSFNCT